MHWSEAFYTPIFRIHQLSLLCRSRILHWIVNTFSQQTNSVCRMWMFAVFLVLVMVWVHTIFTLKINYYTKIPNEFIAIEFVQYKLQSESSRFYCYCYLLFAIAYKQLSFEYENDAFSHVNSHNYIFHLLIYVGYVEYVEYPTYIHNVNSNCKWMQSPNTKRVFGGIIWRDGSEFVNWIHFYRTSHNIFRIFFEFLKFSVMGSMTHTHTHIYTQT